MAEKVGSVTTSAKDAPAKEAITGQPIPGGPSVIIELLFSDLAISLALFLTRVTSLPEFSSAIPRRAWTSGPYGV